MKIIFFGSTNLALPILEALRSQHEIVGVITTPDAKAGRKQILTETPVSALARDLNLPLFKPETLKNNPDFLEKLKNLAADMFAVVAYGKILPAEFINLPKYKTFNVHPSLLPKYRGPSPIVSAIKNGETYTGLTFILIDEQVDHGPMLGQEIIKIEPGDNDFTLTDRLGHAAAKAVNEVIQNYVSGKITPLPQDDSKATLTKIISKSEGKIDWNKTAEEIYNQFRAFYLWPGIFTVWKGQNLKITECVAAEKETRDTAENYGIGTVLEGGLVVCGGSTRLKINRLQLAGKNEVSFEEFTNGYQDFVGSVLG